jgi:arylsulfate sulfotransferase
VLLSPGQSLVTGTNNPLVAAYFYYPASYGTVSVEFGPDTSYGRKTWAIPTPPDGGPVGLYVAGMQQNSTYHMRALFTASDASVTQDTNHTFTTGIFDAETIPKISVTTSGTPQPGIELADSTAGTDPNYLEAYATDLQGNLIWAYDISDRQSSTIVQPIKLLPNGHFLMILSFNSSNVTADNPTASGALDVLREIDLAGNPVREISAATLNAKLAAAGYNLTVDDFHHDVAVLPNGHWVVIANTLKQFTNVTGISGTSNVLGDVLIDLDTSLNPVWVWNEFDHLDVNRHPVGFPDWTHTNAVVYSPDDGNLLVSMRHQAGSSKSTTRTARAPEISSGSSAKAEISH